ncbi:MAG: hypothetical protein ABSA74_01105 [Candidatus Staskawiczbacteria bacterium]|jgi:hypothetical protein
MIKEGSARQERSEEKENLPSEISIYATQETITDEGMATPKGYPYSRKLEKPQTRTTYHWEGPIFLEPGKTPYSSMGKAEIDDLAENFANNYRIHQNPELQKRGESSYSLKFGAPEKTIEEMKKKYPSGRISFRDLTPKEQDEFLEAFQKDNQRAMEAKKKGR